MLLKWALRKLGLSVEVFNMCKYRIYGTLSTAFFTKYKLHKGGDSWPFWSLLYSQHLAHVGIQ